jgi:hypothetical protein
MSDTALAFDGLTLSFWVDGRVIVREAIKNGKITPDAVIAFLQHMKDDLHERIMSLKKLDADPDSIRNALGEFLAISWAIDQLDIRADV